MQGTVWLRYLLGQATAIRVVAESRSAFWTGMVLVLLTAFARNYDQTFIPENPFRWFFGSLMFSFVSGTWLYVVTYGICARQAMADADNCKPPFWSGWRTFMALFWMTAPVAWLYAIPVERFMEPVAAAKANLALLAIVSLWRVLLMSRVIQCLSRTTFFAAFTWVLFASAMEVLAVVFFGGGFAKRIMASMGGMRNSPAEEVLMNGLSTAFSFAFFTAPIALILALVTARRSSAQPFPPALSRGLPWKTLAFAAVFWVAVSIKPQMELQLSFSAETLLKENKARAFLDFMGAHHPSKFSPAKTLPPNSYEWEIFSQLPSCFEVVRDTDPPWLRQNLVQRLDEMTMQFGARWISDKSSREERIDNMQIGFGMTDFNPTKWNQIFDGLERIPEGTDWLKRNDLALEALKTWNVGRDSSDNETTLQWLALSNRIEALTQKVLTNR